MRPVDPQPEALAPVPFPRPRRSSAPEWSPRARFRFKPLGSGSFPVPTIRSLEAQWRPIPAST